MLTKGFTEWSPDRKWRHSHICEGNNENFNIENWRVWKIQKLLNNLTKIYYNEDSYIKVIILY